MLQAAGLSDCTSLPWDVRGPQAPSDGGPQTHKKQKYREGSQRWANAGGKHKEKFALYHKKKAQGVTGDDLGFFHPYARGGHWEAEAIAQGIDPPWKQRELGSASSNQ